VSIFSKNVAEALRLTEKAEDAGADLVEVRLDHLESHSGLADLAADGKAPKIATNRPRSRGGEFDGTEAERKRILLTAAKGGFEYVDIELTNPELEDMVKELTTLGVKPIVSFHEHTRALNLSELNSILEKEVTSGADVCKIVTTAQRIEENLTLLSFTQAASARAKVVCFGMGEQGRVSRLLSPLFGGFFTFASLERGNETAPGQMTIQEMRAAYKLLGLE
jgi:3-dehydroquinate dehydratase/shikimate dehydrogenase